MIDADVKSSQDYESRLERVEVRIKNGLREYHIKHQDTEVHIGNTPTCSVVLDNVEIFAKLEWFNYFSMYLKDLNLKHGSIKMRPALHMILESLRSGTLKTRMIEPTSGNTGIAMAALAKVLGLEFQPIISYKVTDEVKTLFKQMGVEPFEVDDDLCPRVSNTDTDQAIAVAKSLAFSPRSEHLYTWLNQYENYNNPKSHYDTASEILALNKEIDAVVVGVGTGGTYVGLKQILEEKSVKVIGIQPENGHHLQGLRNLAESPLMPKILEDAKVSRSEFPVVTDKEAFAMIKKVYKEKNVLLGASSGAVLHYSRLLAKEGKSVLTLFSDTAYNYQGMYKTMGILKDNVDFNTYYDLEIVDRLGARIF